jgi:hypothetical protein
MLHSLALHSQQAAWLCSSQLLLHVTRLLYAVITTAFKLMQRTHDRESPGEER